MDIYYAHSENSNNECELLECHLEKTSKLSSLYADSFGEGEAGKLLGSMHDVGKASVLFQSVLKKKEFNVNHAATGACFMYNRNSLLARVIYAHHDGLKWDIKDWLNESVAKEGSHDDIGKRFAVSGAEQYNKLKEYAAPYMINSKPILIENVDSYYANLSEMLHARLLLSCLCDADYTATASHYDETVLNYSENIIDAKCILNKLEEYKYEISKNSTSDTGLNKIRDSVYNDCLKAAECSPGMFTLTAPTGTGKTLALLAFAAKHASVYGKKRIIIVLPFLSIISQNAGIYRKICGDVLEAHSMASYSNKDEEKDDELKLITEKWNSPFIITTSVKFFEAFFKSQPSDLRFLHSIADSVIVFDEAQCIAPGLTGTTIETMRMMCEMFRCTVVFSTATQPAFEQRKDLIYKPHEIISKPQFLYDNTRRVTIEWRNNCAVSLSQIADEMSELDSVCCVLNRKDHTQKLYELLSQKCSDGCFHISTNMCSEHRKNVIKEITERLKAHKPCRLVSTSCIEAGVDLDFAYMYRAFAPLEAIIQCAGRCNRNGKQEGRMVVFEPDEEKLYPSVSYKNCTLKVKNLLCRHEIDIYNTEHIKEYYTDLFMDSNYDHDKRQLEKAINEHDFEEAERQYKLIPQSGIDVLVPYKKNIELFNVLADEARTKGISKDWMKRASPVTVTSYNADKIADISERCMIYTRNGKVDSDWYILLSDKFYDNATGLHFDNESSLDYLF